MQAAETFTIRDLLEIARNPAIGAGFCELTCLMGKYEAFPIAL